MKPFPQCEECKEDTKIVLSEKRSKICFLNPQKRKILVITIDGCAIDDNETPRCDYALVPSADVEIYVELKGSNIAHAVEQIESTIKLVSENPRQTRKHCFVVSTRVPKQTTSIQQLQLQFRQKFNAKLRIKNTPDECDLEDLLA